jgi:hypothetical protein
LPANARGLNGTDTLREVDWPPGIFPVRIDDEPTVPWAVLTTARQLARPGTAALLATTKLTMAAGWVVTPACSWVETVARTEVTEYAGCDEPTA